MQRRPALASLHTVRARAELPVRVPARASLLTRMETSPSQGVEVLVLADQDFEDMFLADTQARLGRVTLREHDYVASPPPTTTQVSCHSENENCPF